MADNSNTDLGRIGSGPLVPHEGFELMQQLTVFIKETDNAGRRPLYLAILEMVQENDCAGATVFKGIAGYSSSSRTIQRAGFADIQQHLPLVIVIVDTATRIEMLLPRLEEMVRPNGGLLTIQDLGGHRYLHATLPHGKK
jgi:uncharacterized protein